MHHAAARGDVRTMTFLLDEGAKLEANDKNSETPLVGVILSRCSARCSHRARCLLQLHAVRKGQTNAATWLVAERRANVDAKDRQGKTAVMFAISSQNVPMLKVSLLAAPRFSSPAKLTPPPARPRKAILSLRASMAVVDKVWGW